MAQKNLNMLSKAELIALLSQQTADTAMPAVTAPSDDNLTKLVEALATIQVHQQQQKGTPYDQDDVKLSLELENVSGMAIGMEVRDPINGSTRSLSFPRPGDKHKVSNRQVRELRSEYPYFFENGLVAVVGVEDNNPNLVADVKALIEALAIDEVNGRIEAITSTETLFKIFNYIETRRYVNVDSDGVATESNDARGNRATTLEIRNIDAKEMAIFGAVQRRITTLTNTVMGN
jgi:hypothetical protein